VSTIILGGGIAGLSLAHFLKSSSMVLEKESQLGGLSRSFVMNGVPYDIGPHIIFSKNQEVLKLHTTLIETNKIRRSNRIYHKGVFVKYPFENDLAALEPEERDYCLHEFLNNPYENYPAGNMQQFFLKTFGEGITRLYLQPYNQKIWKLDPSCLDTQMVERIPKPPREDVIKSAQGIATEGYTHQLYFHYPKEGGFQTLVKAYAEKALAKCEIVRQATVERVRKQGARWQVYTNRGLFEGDTLVNCMPLHELFRCLEAPAEAGRIDNPSYDEARATVERLKFNSIHIVVVQAKKDDLGENFAVYFADPGILFHRLSKLNSLGEGYCLPGGGSSLMAEITFRPNSYLQNLDREAIKRRVVADLAKLNLIDNADVLDVDVKTFPYAYVIYDLNHRKNTDFVLNYLSKIGIACCGRFAEFEYLNSDGVVERTRKLADRLNGDCS
jgi:protoporphyrinogen oxidase